MIIAWNGIQYNNSLYLTKSSVVIKKFNFCHYLNWLSPFNFHNNLFLGEKLVSLEPCSIRSFPLSSLIRGLKKQLSPLIEWSRTRSIGSTFQDSICPAFGVREFGNLSVLPCSSPRSRVCQQVLPFPQTTISDLVRVATLPRFHLPVLCNFHTMSSQWRWFNPAEGDIGSTFSSWNCDQWISCLCSIIESFASYCSNYS